MNNNDPRFELIRRHRDGEATPEELTQLESHLRTDPVFREAYVRYMNLDVALGAVAKTISPSVKVHVNFRSNWLQWRPLWAAAAGIVLGMFCTSVVFAYVAPSLERVKTISIEGFESGVSKTAPGLPRETGRWAGDEAEVVSAERGIKPRNGKKMLRFLSATYPGENSPRSQWGDVYRLVDVRDLAGEGCKVVRLSASFAQGTVTAEEAFSCSVDAMALDMELIDLSAGYNLTWLGQHSSAASQRKVALSSAGRWQDVSVELPITAETRYVVMHLAVVQDHPAIESGVVQFSSHYMDDVRLEVISGR